MNFKKKLSVIFTSLTLIASSSCSESQMEFDTIRGKRNLYDFNTYLRNKGLNMSNVTAESDGEIVHIYEKKYEMYSATPETNIEDILNEFYIDDYELSRIKLIKEHRDFRDGEKIKVYKNIVYDFSLEELDGVSAYQYHFVQPGETLEEISDEYGVSIEILLHYNTISDPNNIEAYSTFKVPKKDVKRKTSKKN